MKLFSKYSRFILLLLFLVGVFSVGLFAQTGSDYSRALEFYNQGNDSLHSEKYLAALENFTRAYELYKHTEIAYAICHVSSLLKRYKQTEKYAKLALDGNPSLNLSVREEAESLLNWAKTMQTPDFEGYGKGDILRPTTANPPQRLRKKDPPLQGVYTIRQKSTGRYVDAYQRGNDYALTTRKAQNNDTQRWLIKAP